MAAFSKLIKTPDKRSWATLDQIQWLVGWLPDYIKAQQSHELHHFWPKLFAAWLQEFPLPAVTATDVLAPEADYEADDDSDVPASSADEAAVKQDKIKKKKKESKKKRLAKKAALNAKLSLPERILGQWTEKKHGQLKTFMRWHSGATRAPRKKKGAEATSIWLTANSAAKPRRRLQETEAYIHLHYKERIAEAVHQRIQGSSDDSGPMINVIRQVAKELYADEDDETRTAVAAYIETKHAEALASLASAELDTVDPSPEQYQDGINLLPSYLEAVLSEASRRTGWSFSVLMGGPMPVNNGDIQTASINIGHTTTGITFKDTYREFETAVVRPYTEFLRVVYPSDVRATRALSLEAQAATKDSTLDSHDANVAIFDVHSSSSPDTSNAAPIVPATATDNVPIPAVDDALTAAVDNLPTTAVHSAPTTAVNSAPTTAVNSAPSTAVISAPTTALNIAPTTAVDDARTTVVDNTAAVIEVTPPATLSPRFNRKATTAMKATALDSPDTPPRPKPTPPGYKKSLQARALVEAAAAKLKEEQMAAAKALADRVAADTAANVAADQLAAQAAGNILAGAATASVEITPAVPEVAAADDLANVITQTTVAAPSTFSHATHHPLPTMAPAGPCASGEAAEPSARPRRQAVPTAAGAEVAKQLALKEAKAKKAAETRARNIAKRAAEGDGNGSSKKPRVAPNQAPAGGKRKR
ncbi:hypothetical protein HWV62_4559 [Athelia sp. TMB]|nr:hypothetical protein HWV62_4559 [Athelia sp. TMB]